jgi:dipeptidyl aminopeptidase/acylaminoacyl peptidase
MNAAEFVDTASADQSPAAAAMAAATGSMPQGWATPPEPIAQILDAPAYPKVMISPDNRWLVELGQRNLVPIADLAQPELAIAGFRLNPATRAPARHHTYHSLQVKAIPQKQALDGAEQSCPAAQQVELPAGAAIGFLRWSPDGHSLGFTLTTDDGLALWVLDLASAAARPVTAPGLNGTYGTPYRWLSGQEVLCKLAQAGNPPPRSPIPPGPIIQENLGQRSPSRTFTNLLKDEYDELLFEHYVTSSLQVITLDGQQTELVPPCLIDEAKPSPDGRYILLTVLHRPYSYQLPSGYFPRTIQVIDRAGQLLYQVDDIPLTDYLSTKFDAVRRGRRGVFWRSDRPATLYWAEALDGGDPSTEAEYRDALYQLDAPFAQEPTLLWRSRDRFRGVMWGREDVALVWERWYDTRQQKAWLINPAHPEQIPTLWIERNFEDRYSEPGEPFTVPGPYHRSVLRFSPQGDAIYFTGRGASPEGVHPFLELRPLDPNQPIQRLWQCQDPYYESIVDLLDFTDDRPFLTLRQSQTEPPNYYVGNWSRGDRHPLTQRTDRAPQFAEVQKRLVRYTRNDGVQLSATLYLPPAYDPQRDGPLPTLFWIYPEEFKSRELAGQVTTAEQTFSRPGGASVLFFLTQGYAVLSNPSVPIIGEAEAEPNDTYIPQLLASIEAAIEFVVAEGVGDRDRLAIGGHSYGAFTTANVLAHCPWFKAGIARSGAYNRSLTPFGFQGEQRTFWEAESTYVEMSPFTHAGKIAAPLLLIHGANDSNAGTYPLQTERFFEALKGLGATVRSVILPLEDHGYHSREAIGHVLWEMLAWCDRYVRGQ